MVRGKDVLERGTHEEVEEVTRGGAARNALLREGATAREERLHGRDGRGEVEQVSAEPGATAEKYGDPARGVSTGPRKGKVGWEAADGRDDKKRRTHRAASLRIDQKLFLSPVARSSGPLPKLDRRVGEEVSITP